MVQKSQSRYSFFFVNMETPIQDFFELQKELDAFTARFNKLVTSKKRQIIDDKTRYSISISDLQTQELKLKNQIKQLNEQKQEVKLKIEEGLKNLESRQANIDELKGEEVTLTEKKHQLDEELNELNNQINDLTEKINKVSEALAEQVSKDTLELTKYEKYLGLKLEVISETVIKFRFSNLDPQNIDKEFWIQLKIDDIEVEDSFPALSKEELAPAVEQFEKTENFKDFLKSIRGLLKKSI